MDTIRFTPTPGTAGTGWFDRQGVERKPSGKDEKTDRPIAVIGRRCGRCGGAGGSEKWGPHGSNTGWTCYDCGGTGCGPNTIVKLYTAEETARLDGSIAKRRATKAEKYRLAQEARVAAEEKGRQERAEMLAADPFMIDFKALMDSFITRSYETGEIEKDRTPDFIRDMWERVQHTDLSDKQRGAVDKFIFNMHERARKASISAWQGEVGDRIEFTAKVVAVRVISYGAPRYQGRFPGDELDKHLIKFETEEGQLLTWKTTKWLDLDTIVTAKGTVKAQNTWDGRKETELTRVMASEKIKPEVESWKEGGRAVRA